MTIYTNDEKGYRFRCTLCKYKSTTYLTQTASRIDGAHHQDNVCKYRFNLLACLAQGFRMCHQHEMNMALMEKYGPKPRKPGHKRRRRRQGKERT